LEQATKEELLTRFKKFLDDSEPVTDESISSCEEESEERDLYAIFVELAALRSEVRAESRLVKTALDQFREVFETLRGGHAALEGELARARAEAQRHERVALKPLLLDILDLRDRLIGALNSTNTTQRGWVDRLLSRAAKNEEPWKEGLRMTLRRLDQILLERRVTPIVTRGRILDPRLARVVATIEAAGQAEGTVIEETRAGFHWDDEVLRLAEVIACKNSSTGKELSDG
jgi:molecular chaperone GrpE